MDQGCSTFLSFLSIQVSPQSISLIICQFCLRGETIFSIKASKWEKLDQGCTFYHFFQWKSRLKVAKMATVILIIIITRRRLRFLSIIPIIISLRCDIRLRRRFFLMFLQKYLGFTKFIKMWKQIIIIVSLQYCN